MMPFTKRGAWFLTFVLLLPLSLRGLGDAQQPAEPKDPYPTAIKPLIKQYCLDCHSTKLKKGSLDLERFTSVQDVRKDLKRWQQVVEQLEAGEMPPPEKPQPSAAQRRQMLDWVRGFLDAEAKARTGDPGHVPLRRLSNAEYDSTIHDLTGVDLRPAREFPADGAAGEGFTNAAESLADITPGLFTRYLGAAKDIADHAVLLPDGLRFSAGKTRRDWTDESLVKLRAFYAQYAGTDGKLPLGPYLLATVRHREALAGGKVTLAEIAAKDKLHLKYLTVLWDSLKEPALTPPSQPLDLIRGRWRTATEKDVASLSAEIAAWQAALWKFVPVGSYRYGATARQVANDPPGRESQAIKLSVKPAPGQSDVVLYLAAQDASPDAAGHVVWHRPRLEGAGKPPLLLRDYDQFGPAHEIDFNKVFAPTARYLAAVSEAAHDRKLSAESLAGKHGVDAVLLKRWIEVLALDHLKKEASADAGRVVPMVTLELLDEKTPPNAERPAINGWRRKGTDLPALLTNASNKVELVPGKMPAHSVAVHPTPKEFVAVVWQSPIDATVQPAVRVTHAHPSCGNGIAWWLEHRHADQARVVDEGTVDLGKETKPSLRSLSVGKGDRLILAIDARDGNHVCDLTEIAFTIAETGKGQRTWNLSADIADSVQSANPHADKHGNKDVWAFVRGPSRPVGKSASSGSIAAASLLGRWRDAAMNRARQAEADKLAGQIQTLFTAPRPSKEKDPDRILYDTFVSSDGPLLKGLDLTRFAGKGGKGTYGIDKRRFGKDPAAGKTVDAASLVVAANSVTEIRLPASLFRGRDFVVDARLAGPSDDRLVRFRVSTSPVTGDLRADGKSAIVAAGASFKRLQQGYAEFRRVFPAFICFPNVVPTDETVSLKMFHREDEPLERLFLGDEAKRHLDRLWSEHLFISQQARAENDYLPQFIGFVTQDQPKELLAYFESQRPIFKKRADDFARECEAAIPRQLDALTDFASLAYRRPLEEREKADLLALYQKLRKKDAGHEEAMRGVLARVLVSPAFLFRIEKAPAGKDPAPVSAWELASRLSYFLWSTGPDEELRRLAAAGKLDEPQVLEAQARRMLRSDRLRMLAIEFGTQWIHVRGFDASKDKNEKLFPTFDANLRKAIYEESILFFQDLFQADRRVTDILDADATFLNETLAKHYGIPGVKGPQWRRVEGVKKHGRGGILGLASVQARQSGASRTSPVLRGNWVVETLLGEKLPRPPANVPILPDEADGDGNLTTRQMVEKHARIASCAVCHVRIDPFGFALERYDAIGRLRLKDAGGLPVDAKATLKDGTQFEGIDGLRTYLLTKKRDVVVRLFSQRLLGYALGRATTLSDTALIDQMTAQMSQNDGRVSAAVLAIVRSPQFRMIRGRDYAD